MNAQTKPRQSFCFCTLALGPLYIAYARLMAIDIEIQSPNTSFLVFTDKPSEFDSHENVRTVFHEQDSIWVAYHDKRFVIDRALQDFGACVFLDSDMRVISPVDANLPESLLPGLNTYYCSPWDEWPKSHTKPKQVWEIELVREAANAIGVDTANCTFMWEQVVGLRGDSKGVDTFISVWDQLAKHFQLKGLHRGIGHAMAVAAAAAELPIVQNRFLGDEGVFKDLFVINKRNNDLPVSDAEAHCFRQHEMLNSLMQRRGLAELQYRLKRAMKKRRYAYLPPKSWATIKLDE